MEKAFKTLSIDVNALNTKVSISIIKLGIHIDEMEKFRKKINDRLNPIYDDWAFEKRLKARNVRRFKITAMWLGIPLTIVSIVYGIVEIIKT